MNCATVFIVRHQRFIMIKLKKKLIQNRDFWVGKSANFPNALTKSVVIIDHHRDKTDQDSNLLHANNYILLLQQQQ